MVEGVLYKLNISAFDTLGLLFAETEVVGVFAVEEEGRISGADALICVR